MKTHLYANGFGRSSCWLTDADARLIEQAARGSAWQLAHVGNGIRIAFTEKELAEMFRMARAEGRAEQRKEKKARA